MYVISEDGYMGGTHVTTRDLTNPETLGIFAKDHIPGSDPKRLTEIEVPEGAIVPDPTKDIHPHTGWLPPNTPGAKIVREWNIQWDDTTGPKLIPLPQTH